ncbi:MAG: serine/threonine protein kinase [Verrucomicrobiaceae bacterium]|nr:serine/threonine protein kinase [Verrucomicrobiaceae bacterium]
MKKNFFPDSQCQILLKSAACPFLSAALVLLAVFGMKNGIFAQTQSAPSAEVAQRLSVLEKGFEEAAEREAELPYKTALLTMNESYVGAVERALNAAMQAGNTAAAVALRDEKKRIEKDEELPSEQADAHASPPIPESLKRLRKTYRETMALHASIRLMRLYPLFDKYSQALNALAVELTKAGKLDDAVQVKKVNEEVSKARTTGNTEPVTVASSGTTKVSALLRSFTNSLGMKFVPVPGTKVLFCIHETRVKDYSAFAEANPGTNEAWKNSKRENVPVGTGSENDPVTYANYDDAHAFNAWLSKKEGHVYRLPTDREWSIAVGIAPKEDETESPKSLGQKNRNDYPWGTKWPPPKDSGNFQDDTMVAKFPSAKSSVGYSDGFPTTAPVMSFKPNSLGIYDLTGNLWEWCEDWGDDTQKGRVLRGGSWSTVDLKSSSRYVMNPVIRWWEWGFRCVVEADK